MHFSVMIKDNNERSGKNKIKEKKDTKKKKSVNQQVCMFEKTSHDVYVSLSLHFLSLHWMQSFIFIEKIKSHVYFYNLLL